MNEEMNQLGQAILESTWRSVEARWPREENDAQGLVEVAAAAVTHLGETVDGFRQITGASVDCRAGCSFCCSLRIDVRAHEVFLILRWLREHWSEDELESLRRDASLTRVRLLGLGDEERARVQLPCLLLRDGLCSVYEVRPAACRRYLSVSVAACGELWAGTGDGGGIQHPLVAEAGRFAAMGLNNAFISRGYDGFSYDLPLALGEALEDPLCEERWLRKEPAFTEEAQSRTPAGFSQQEAVRRLKASLAGAAAKLAMLLLVIWAWGASGAVAGELPHSPAVLALQTATPNGPGDYQRKIIFEGLERSCLIHVPPGLKSGRPAPLVLVLHGAGMNATMMTSFSGMNAQSDAAGFIAVYPNGLGLAETFLTWNSGGIGPVRRKPDDVAFIRALLDDLGTVLTLDPKRIYAAGLSNGGMMAYRLGVELADRIAAIAAVAGTLALDDPQPARPVPLIHFHGTADRIVPYQGSEKKGWSRTPFLSVPETIARWVALCECPAEPIVKVHPNRFDDGTTVTTSTYSPGKNGAEVVLVKITGGGHTWPGQQPQVSFIGKSTREISANRMIWEFFLRHSMR